MPDSEPSPNAFIFDVEQDVQTHPDRYAEAVAWWNGNYSLAARRREIAARLREWRKIAKPAKWKQGTSWKAQHLADWTFLARVRDAMNAFPRDPAGWHRLSIQQAKRIVLVAVLIARPDFDGAKAGLQEAAQWSDGRLLDGDDPFGRDWADAGSFRSWGDEDGDNGRWRKLAATAWALVRATAELVGNSKGMTWQRALKAAEAHCSRNPFPGVNALAKIVGCSASTMSKAIDRSTKLRALLVEHETQRTSVHALAMTEGVAATTTQSREPDPIDAASASTDSLFRRLVEEAKPSERAALNAMTASQQRELLATIEHDPDKSQSVRGRKR